jgi:hypothetical protein
LGAAALVAAFKNLPSARESVALGVNQALNFESHFDIAAAVKPVACAAFVGLELWKLSLPKAQNEWLDLADAGHIPDLEIEPVGNDR